MAYRENKDDYLLVLLIAIMYSNMASQTKHPPNRNAVVAQVRERRREEGEGEGEGEERGGRGRGEGRRGTGGRERRMLPLFPHRPLLSYTST